MESGSPKVDLIVFSDSPILIDSNLDVVTYLLSFLYKETAVETPAIKTTSVITTVNKRCVLTKCSI